MPLCSGVTCLVHIIKNARALGKPITLRLKWSLPPESRIRELVWILDGIGGDGQGPIPATAARIESGGDGLIILLPAEFQIHVFT